MSTTDSSETPSTQRSGKIARTRSKAGTGKTTQDAATGKSSTVTGRPRKKPVPQNKPVKAEASDKLTHETGVVDPYQSGRRVWPD